MPECYLHRTVLAGIPCLFFNWINEKTNIQNAQSVTSEQGLLVHIWGKFAAAILLLTQFFNS